MSSAKYFVGDVRKVLATLPDNSVDMVMSSPPFLALRSYLPADHPDKALEMGSEATPGEFIDGLLDVVEELDRVLAPHGSICIELGDTYSGSGGAGGDWVEGSGQRVYTRGADIPDFSTMPPRKGDGWPLAKSQCLIPELFRFSLAYGFNPLTGRQTDRWRVRNTVRWCRPNPPVDALGDKFRPATSEMVIATKSAKRYFDLDAVRAPGNAFDRDGEHRGGAKAAKTPEGGGYNHVPGSTVMTNHPAGAPPLDYWVIPTQPYAGSHYATYPEALCVTPIKAMCPERVCVVCGDPSRRIVDTSYVDSNGKPASRGTWSSGVAQGKGAHANKTEVRTTTTTLGWTDCACRYDAGAPEYLAAALDAGGDNHWRRGVVLDPFAGSGTTGAVATGHGRDAILIDLDSRNAELAAERIGMFMTVVEPGDAA